jgi:hypothetical protein
VQGKVLPGSKAAQVSASVIDPQALSQRPANQAQSDAVVASQLASVASARKATAIESVRDITADVILSDLRRARRDHPGPAVAQVPMVPPLQVREQQSSAVAQVAPECLRGRAEIDWPDRAGMPHAA